LIKSENIEDNKLMLLELKTLKYISKKKYDKYIIEFNHNKIKKKSVYLYI
jgi:hypothetical protein